MKLRGKRECTSCGTQWSYYETGSVACPSCGSLRSVGVAERALHTDTPIELDLSDHRDRFGSAEGVLPDEGVTDLKRDLRRYVHRRGFIRGGELLALDETYLAARELIQVADAYDRLVDPTEADRLYLLDLLSGADAGNRPEPAAVPDSLRGARGLADAASIADYREELITYLDASPDGDARNVLGAIREEVKRIEALQGDVDPAEIEGLVHAVNQVGTYLRDGDRDALVEAEARASGVQL